KPVQREFPFVTIQRVQFDASRRFQGAKITLFRSEDPEKVIFESIAKDHLLQSFVDFVQDRVANPHAHRVSDPVEAGPEDDFITGLERLSQLKSAGMLTEAEFQAAKQKLLGDRDQ